MHKVSPVAFQRLLSKIPLTHGFVDTSEPLAARRQIQACKCLVRGSITKRMEGAAIDPNHAAIAELPNFRFQNLLK